MLNHILGQTVAKALNCETISANIECLAPLTGRTLQLKSLNLSMKFPLLLHMDYLYLASWQPYTLRNLTGAV